jgi:hypothetical protein
MTQHVEVSNVERIVQLLRPDDEHIEQCRRDAAEAIGLVAVLPPCAPPVTTKKKLAVVTARLKAVQEAIDKLPYGERMVMRVHALRKLKDIAGQAEELSARITAKRSGGSPKLQRIAAQKQYAAERALKLLVVYDGKERPTSMRGGKLYRIAALLSGQKSGMERACARALSESKVGTARSS